MALVGQFNSILKQCLRDGDTYRRRPPQGPPSTYPAISQEAIDGLSRTGTGEETDNKKEHFAYSKITLVDDSPNPIRVHLPSPEEDLADVYVCGIDGSNQRIQRGGFHFILSRAAMVVFRYSGSGKKPYFYKHVEDDTAVVWADGNVFKEEIKLWTRSLSEESEILSTLKQDRQYPMIRVYKAGEKSPASHALGLAVQVQQGLELLCIPKTPQGAQRAICIKDGPLFSTSTAVNDVKDGLGIIRSDEWKNSVLLACSKRVGESTLLWQMLLDEQGADWRNQWFPGQEITDSSIRSLPSDSLLLPRILKPGYRTPMVKAIPVARVGIVKERGGIPDLTPVACYYLSRNRPHTYIRLEMPIFMWERDREMANYAIKIAAWQHDLGHNAPHVMNVADRMCDISHERDILEKQTDAALWGRGLNFLRGYDE